MIFAMAVVFITGVVFIMALYEWLDVGFVREAEKKAAKIAQRYAQPRLTGMQRHERACKPQPRHQKPIAGQPSR